MLNIEEAAMKSLCKALTRVTKEIFLRNLRLNDSAVKGVISNSLKCETLKLCQCEVYSYYYLRIKSIPESRMSYLGLDSCHVSCRVRPDFRVLIDAIKPIIKSPSLKYLNIYNCGVGSEEVMKMLEKEELEPITITQHEDFPFED